ncbi:MAG: hypothetical protein ACW98D_10075 [Promethearchaeota archaeon]|jgi:hypothetical protein
MKENFNSQWNYNGNQGVYNKYSLIFEGFIRSEYEESILLEFRKDKETIISYQLKRIVADVKPSNYNGWRIYKEGLRSNLEINEIWRVLWRS